MKPAQTPEAMGPQLKDMLIVDTTRSAADFLEEQLARPRKQSAPVICLDARTDGIDKVQAWLAAFDAALEKKTDTPVPYFPRRIVVAPENDETSPLTAALRDRMDTSLIGTANVADNACLVYREHFLNVLEAARSREIPPQKPLTPEERASLRPIRDRLKGAELAEWDQIEEGLANWGVDPHTQTGMGETS